MIISKIVAFGVIKSTNYLRTIKASTKGLMRILDRRGGFIEQYFFENACDAAKQSTVNVMDT